MLILAMLFALLLKNCAISALSRKSDYKNHTPTSLALSKETPVLVGKFSLFLRMRTLKLLTILLKPIKTATCTNRKIVLREPI